MKLKFLIVCTIGVGALGLPFLYFYPFDPVVFQSEESSTPQTGAIFNRVSFQQIESNDVWLMQQKQEGFHADFGKWDRLAIVVDRSQRPKVARFYQFEPGPIGLSGSESEYRVACGMCHVNGPRAIRALQSIEAPLDLLDRVRISWWNYRIRNYGRVIPSSHDRLNGRNRQVPFQFSGEFAQKKLTVKACTKCHNNTDQGRGFLVMQNFPTIDFMTKNGYMPPRGKKLSSISANEIQEFQSQAHQPRTLKN